MSPTTFSNLHWCSTNAKNTSISNTLNLATEDKLINCNLVSNLTSVRLHCIMIKYSSFLMLYKSEVYYVHHVEQIFCLGTAVW